jgi:hypothetical protein
MVEYPVMAKNQFQPLKPISTMVKAKSRITRKLIID